jgi:hypothetical protein
MFPFSSVIAEPNITDTFAMDLAILARLSHQRIKSVDSQIGSIETSNCQGIGFLRGFHRKFFGMNSVDRRNQQETIHSIADDLRFFIEPSSN